jgi:16S rRNA (uracil1498-N3)-methyltransferase
MPVYPQILIESRTVKGNVRVDGSEAFHLTRVLRARKGSKFIGFDGAGRGWLCEVREVKRANVEAIIVEELPGQSKPRPEVTIAIGIIKGQRMDSAVEKAAELGAAAIIPLITRYTAIRPNPGRLERWRSIALAAVKQSRRFHLPVIMDPMDLPDALAYGSSLGQTWAFDLNPAGIPVGDIRREESIPDKLTLLIGPEGGFSVEESTTFDQWGVVRVSLGNHPLRTETAVAVSLGLINFLYSRS